MTLLHTFSKRRIPGFYILPEISISLRLFLIVLLIFIGIILQTIHIIAGFILVLAGIGLTLLKSISNTPLYKKKGQGKWVNVTDKEFIRIRDHYHNTKRWANSYFSANSLKGNLFFLLLLGLGGVIGYCLSHYSITLVKIWALDCGSFIVLFFLTGERHPYHPKILLLKIGEFMKIIEFLQKSTDPQIIIQPMMEIIPAKKDSGIPDDARLVLKFRSAPGDFIGLQIQLSINRVGSRSFPYLYTVFVGKKGFDFKQRITDPEISRITDDLKKKYVLEPKQTNDVDILVFRQLTTKKTGYHTNPKKQREIVILSISLLKKMFLEANKNT